jgi:hypothetical protein
MFSRGDVLRLKSMNDKVDFISGNIGRVSDKSLHRACMTWDMETVNIEEELINCFGIFRISMLEKVKFSVDMLGAVS